MAAFKDDVKGTKGFCDEVFTEFDEIKRKINRLREKAHAEGADKDVIGMFERHLNELLDQIDWKFQILAHSCPYDWKGSAGFENDVHVKETEKSPDSDTFSAGYLGG